MRGYIIFFLVLSFSAFSMGAISLYDEYGNPFGVGAASGLPFDPLEVNIYSDDDSDWTGYLVLDYFYSDASLTNPQTFYEAGINGSNSEFSQTGIGVGYQFTSALFPASGIQHAADLVIEQVGMYYISLYDERLDIRDPIDYLKVWIGAGTGALADSVIDGNYSVDAEDTIRLSGRHSLYNLDLTWSIEGNLIGHDEMQEISYDTLVNTFGLTPGTYQVELHTTGFSEWWEGEEYHYEFVEDYDYADLVIIPEPACMSLILFGSLFIIRRKMISLV